MGRDSITPAASIIDSGYEFELHIIFMAVITYMIGFRAEKKKGIGKRSLYPLDRTTSHLIDQLAGCDFIKHVGFQRK